MAILKNIEMIFYWSHGHSFIVEFARYPLKNGGLLLCRVAVCSLIEGRYV